MKSRYSFAAPKPSVRTGLESLITLGNDLDVTEIPGGENPDPYMPEERRPVKADEQLPYCPVYFVKKLENGGEEWGCDITGSIVDIPEYINLLDKLQTMTEKDVMQIYIDSPGGCVTTGTAICSLIDVCRGKVITHATAMCASAGSLIWSAGHECKVGSYALFMYHMSSHMDFGNSLGIKNNAEHCVNYVIRCLRMSAVKKGHITEEELNVLATTQRNVWIDAATMRDRVQSPPPVGVDNVPENTDDTKETPNE